MANRNIDKSKFYPSPFLTLNELINLALIMVSSISISLLTNWILSSYFGIDIAGSLMYKSNDGWCDYPTQGIGTHCFGDFNERFAPSSKDLWVAYPNNLETTPIGPFVTSLFNLLLTFFSARQILIFFYIISFTLLVLPLAKASKGSRFIIRLFIIGLFGISSYPALVLLDRLNYLVFSIPFLFYLYSALIVKNKFRIKLFLVILVTIKPQFILLGIIVIALEGWWSYFKLTFIQVISIFSLIVLAGAGDFGRISQYLRVLMGYGGVMWSFNTANPPNASLANVFYTIYSIARRLVIGESLTTTKYSDLVFVIISGSVSLAILVFIIGSVKKFDLCELVFILSLVAVLGFGKYVASYYLIVVLPFISTSIKASLRESKVLYNLTADKYAIQKSFLFAYFFSCSVILIPNFNFPIDTINGTNVIPILNPILATFFWFMFIFDRLKRSRKYRNAI